MVRITPRWEEWEVEYLTEVLTTPSDDKPSIEEIQSHLIGRTKRSIQVKTSQLSKEMPACTVHRRTKTDIRLKQQAIALYCEGLSGINISEELGLSYSTLLHLFERWGLQFRWKIPKRVQAIKEKERDRGLLWMW